MCDLIKKTLLLLNNVREETQVIQEQDSLGFNLKLWSTNIY